MIYILETPRGVRRVQLDNQVVAVGSDRQCTIVVDDDPQVVRRHVELVPGIEGIGVVPIAIVVVDGELLDANRDVSFRQAVRIGATTIRFAPDRDRCAPAAWTQVPPPRAWRHELAASAVEHALLAELRVRPADDATRSVYADWLAEQGHGVLADEVRGVAVDPAAVVRGSPTEWRAIASRPPIVGCDSHACPPAWNALAATSDNERARRCEECARLVRYCASAIEIRGCIARREPYVPDPALASGGGWPDRIDAALHAIAQPQWTIDRWHDRPSWTVEVRRTGVLGGGYTVVLGTATLHVHYGGTDAGPISIAGPPRHGTVELQLAGLDDAAVREWLRDAFATHAPSAWGYS